MKIVVLGFDKPDILVAFIRLFKFNHENPFLSFLVLNFTELGIVVEEIS